MGRDGYTGLAVLAASLFLFWSTLGLERHPMVPVGPGFYPQLVLGITAVMALALLAWDLYVQRRRRTAPVAAAAVATEPRNYRLVLITFGIFALYVVALPWLGFRLATLVFIVAMQVVLEPPASPRRWILVAAVALATTIATYLVFEQYLKVLLPRGRWTDF